MEKVERLLLLGSGTLGAALRKAFSHFGWQVSQGSRNGLRSGAEFDFELGNQLRLPPRSGSFPLGIYALGMNGIADCNNNPDASKLINHVYAAQAIREMLNFCDNIVVISSLEAYRCSSSVLASPNCRSVYGIHKLELENQILEEFDNRVHVVRLSKVFSGPEIRNMFSNWEKALLLQTTVKINRSRQMFPLWAGAVGEIFHSIDWANYMRGRRLSFLSSLEPISYLTIFEWLFDGKCAAFKINDMSDLRHELLPRLETFVDLEESQKQLVKIKYLKSQIIGAIND